jgi:hypothetical protein
MGLGVDHPPQLGAKVKVKIPLYLYCGRSWAVIGRPLPSTEPLEGPALDTARYIPEQNAAHLAQFLDKSLTQHLKIHYEHFVLNLLF